MARGWKAVLGLALLGVGLPFLLAADEWPQWRGPNRDGVVAPSLVPAKWSPKLTLKWKVKVGEGYSSPVVSGQHVYVLTREEDQEVVSCLTLDTGRIVWRDRYPAPYRLHPAAVPHGKGPKSTPVVAGGRLYTFGISGILSSYDSADGRLRWRKQFSDQFSETAPWYGTAMSPVVDGKLLIAHVGGHDRGGLTAFNAGTGQPVWQWTGDGPAYASPIVVELAGTRQVITQTQQNIVGVSATRGELLWRIPFTTEYVQNIVTPVAYERTLIFSGYGKGTVAYQIAKGARGWSAKEIWKNVDVSMYMNSPVLSGSLLFGFSQYKKGQFFCLDARTGATLWTGPPRQGENAAILSLGEVLVFLTNEADLILAKASGKGFEPLHRYTVAESPTWAHPVVLGNRLLVKDGTSLALWTVDEAEKAAAPTSGISSEN